MKLSVEVRATTRTVLRLAAVSVVLSVIGGMFMADSHVDAVADADRLEQVNATRDAASWKVFAGTVAAQRLADDKVVAQLAARDKAAAERVERKQSAMEKAAREQAARDKAAREQIAREKAAVKKAAREAVLRAKAKERAAIRAKAEQRMAARQAAALSALIREARAAARQEALREARAARRKQLAEHVVAGEMTQSDVVGALMPRVGGRPGQRYPTLTARQQTRLRSLVRSVADGKRYACPVASGGMQRGIAAGAPVSVWSGTGVLLAATTLTGGEVSTKGCSFHFRAAVADTGRYRVGFTHREAVTYTRRSMVASGWRVRLTVAGGR